MPNLYPDCNGVMQRVSCSQSQKGGKGNVDLNLTECCHCPQQPHSAGCHGGTAKREDERWRWTGGGDYFSVVWITVLFKQGSSHFRSLCVEISVFSAHLPNMKIKQKLVLCKSKELNAYKCTSRFKNGIYGISLYLDWLWWAFPYTALCRDVISINKGVGLFRWVFQTSY